MPPNDKIITFKSPAFTVASDVPELAPETETEHLTKTEAAVVDMAMFLLDNKSKIRNFVCGIACEVTVPEDEDIDTEFHLVTSPIEVRDYALALRLFEDGFRRNLERVIEE